MATLSLNWIYQPRLSLGDIYAIFYFSIGGITGEGGNERDNLANWFPLECLIAIPSACLSLRMLDTRHGVDKGSPFLASPCELSFRTLYLYANRTRNALIIQFCNCCRRCQRFAFELHAEFISIINAVGCILSYYYTRERKRERDRKRESRMESDCRQVCSEAWKCQLKLTNHRHQDQLRFSIRTGGGKECRPSKQTRISLMRKRKRGR